MTRMKYFAFALATLLCSLLTVEAQTSTAANDESASHAATPQATPSRITGSSSEQPLLFVNNLGTPTGNAVVAIRGQANSGYGLQGVGQIGVDGSGGGTGTGVIGSSSGQGTGVSGSSNSGVGVLGYSSTGKGVSASGGEAGIYGIGTSATSAGVSGIGGSFGVLGTSTGVGVSGVTTGNASGVSKGVSGSSAGSGIGVYGRSATGVAIYGRADAVGYSGFFEGRMEVRGAVNIIGDVSGRQLTVTSCNGCANVVSDRNLKANFSAANPRSILTRLASLPIQSWNYKTDAAAVRHIGPMSQDFHAAFGLGDSDQTINTVDANGVTMAAIQGLYQMIKEKDEKIEQLEQRLERLERSTRRTNRVARVRR